MYQTFNKNKQRKHRHVRVRSKLSGTKSCPRVSVFRSNRYIYAQIIDDASHKVLTSSSSLLLGLDKPGTKEAAKKVGADLALKAKNLKIKKVVFDRSGYLYHGQVAELATGLRENGIVF